MDKEILTMEEAAELFNVSMKTFIKLLKEEKVPARKIGREWRFSRKALIEWLSSGDSQNYSSSEGDAMEFFNEVAPDWEDIRKNYYDQSITDKLLDNNLLNGNTTLMDLGAGDGYISLAVANNVDKVIAVDISNIMLKELKKKASKKGISNIEIVVGDGLDVPVEDESIDVVCASMYLHHISQPEIALKEMFRLLKPSGKVFIADFVQHKNTEFQQKMHDIWPGFNISELIEQLENCGFKNINAININDSVKRKIGRKRTNPSVFILTAEKHNN